MISVLYSWLSPFAAYRNRWRAGLQQTQSACILYWSAAYVTSADDARVAQPSATWSAQLLSLISRYGERKRRRRQQVATSDGRLANNKTTISGSKVYVDLYSASSYNYQSINQSINQWLVWRRHYSSWRRRVRGAGMSHVISWRRLRTGETWDVW